MADVLTVSDFAKRKLAAGRKPAKAAKRAGLMNIAEVAEDLGISKQAVHKAILAGKLKSYRIVHDHDRDKLVALLVDGASVNQYELIRALQHRDEADGR